MSAILSVYARLGKDAEVRQMQDGTYVANLALPWNYGRKDDNGNQPTQWLDAALWGQRAASLAPYLLKGQGFHLAIEDVHIEEFTRGDGTGGSKLVGRVVTIAFAGPSPQEQEQQGRPQRQQGQQQGNGQRQQQGQQRQPNNSQQGYGSQRGGQQARQPQGQGGYGGNGQGRRPQQGNGFEDMDSDIPY